MEALVKVLLGLGRMCNRLGCYGGSRKKDGVLGAWRKEREDI